MAKRWLLLLLCLVALPLLFAGLCHRGFTDNEGMYAEAARARDVATTASSPSSPQSLRGRAAGEVAVKGPVGDAAGHGRVPVDDAPLSLYLPSERCARRSK